MEQTFMHIAKAIKQLRIDRKISQKDFAETIGVSPAAVCNWEKGANKLDLDTLLKISTVYDVPASYFVGEVISDKLSDEEKAVIAKYRSDENFKRVVKHLLTL